MSGPVNPHRSDVITLTMAEALQIAKVVHESIRTFREAHGEHSLKTFERMPADYRDDLARKVQLIVMVPDMDASDLQHTWVLDRQSDGWTHGDVYDEAAKTDPDLVLFDMLPAKRQVEDKLTKAVTEAVLWLKIHASAFGPA